MLPQPSKKVAFQLSNPGIQPYTGGVELLLQQLAAALLQRKKTLASAESCTGGLLGAALTRQPGSSAWYVGGVVAYSNVLKSRWLGVPAEVLRDHGAVSTETAQAMAEGVRKESGADYAVALTGIAGPDGGTAEKPVGLVYIAVAGPGRTRVLEYRFSGTRSEIRAAAVETALRVALCAVEA